MREYKFKAKDEKGQWIYGHYVKMDYHTIHSLESGEFVIIDPDTLCQLIFTQAGVEFYENDKVIYDTTLFSDAEDAVIRGVLEYNSDVTLFPMGYVISTGNGYIQADIGDYTNLGNRYDKVNKEN